MGLLVIVMALFIWISVSFILARIFTKWVRGTFRNGAIFIATMIIFTLPAVDEIIGKYQFKSICKKKSVIDVVNEHEGKTVYFIKPSMVAIDGYVLPIKMQYWKFADKETNKIIFSYKVFYSSGGFLGRILQLSDDGGPVMFYGTCKPREARNYKKMIVDLKVNEVDR